MAEVTTNPAQGVAESGAQTPQTPTFDAAAFEQRLREIDPQWNLNNFDEMGKKMRQSLSKQGQENNELRTKWSKYEQLDQEISRDQVLRARLDQTIREYYGEGNGSGAPEAPTTRYPVAQAFDPAMQRIATVETELVTMRVNNELSELERKGFPMDEERRQEVVRRVLQTQWGTGRDHYMAAFGEEVVKIKQAEAAQAVKAEIQGNSGMYTPSPAKAQGVAAKVDVANMSEAEWQAYSRERTKGLSGPFRE